MAYERNNPSRRNRVHNGYVYPNGMIPPAKPTSAAHDPHPAKAAAMGAEPAVALRMMSQADREAEARRVLDVGPGASQDEVCAAFKQAALRAHPAENPEDTKAATLMYRRVRAAYLSLKEGASAEEIPSTNWRPSLTDMDPDSENDSNGHEHQVLPAFEPKLDQRSRRSRTVSAIEKKLNRTQSMNLLFQFGGTPAGGDKPSKAWASEGDRCIVGLCTIQGSALVGHSQFVRHVLVPFVCTIDQSGDSSLVFLVFFPLLQPRVGHLTGDESGIDAGTERVAHLEQR